MRISILANFVFLIAAFLVALILGKEVFVPLAFAILIAFLLYPASKFLEKKMPRVVSISLVFLATATLALALIAGFSMLFRNILSEVKNLDFEFNEFVNSCCGWVSNFFGVEDETILQMLQDNAGGIVEGPLNFLSTQLLNSTSILFSALVTGILAFLLILYRTAFKNFIIFQLEPKNRKEAKIAMKEVQSVSQQYIVGLVKVMLVLGTLNALGLWLIGVKFPLFWGFFAALLTIIPFIGTFIGGFLPFIFALITTGTFWQPAAVVVLFMTIQFLEDNFIKPKIVGNEVDINPFVAILSLIIGGVIWGIPGFVLALPYVAVLKILFENFDETQSLAALMSSEIYDKPGIFKEEFSDKKHSIVSLFKFKKGKNKSSE